MHAVVIDSVYFPDSRVASRGLAVSPVTQPDPMHGPHNVQLFQSMPDPPRQSDEQGFGRSPGQQWPHQVHVEQYNFTMLNSHAWPDPAGDVIPDEVAGWSAPVYYEQSAHGKHIWPTPIAIEVPDTQTYTDLGEVGA